MRARDFMSFEEAEVTMDDSNILNIKGYNNSGKSALIKAFEVAMMNMYPTNQGAFIRDGQKKFSIEIGFSDGVVLKREKFSDGRGLYELIGPKGETVFTTKQGRTYGKITGVPEPIAKYLGLVELEKGYLNSRTNLDPHFLTDTSGSENFAALSNILKADELHRAQMALKKDLRESVNDIAVARSELQVHREILAETPSREWLDKVKCILEQSAASVREASVRDRDLRNLMGIIRDLDGVVVYDAIERVEGIERIQRARSLATLTESVLEPIPEEVEPISGTDRVSILKGVLSKINGLEEDIVWDSVDEINLSRVEECRVIKDSLEGVLKAVSAERNLRTRLEELNEKMSKQDVTKFVCSSCGKTNFVHSHKEEK